ncbi:MAG: SirB2 family protein [Gammaproteobacteria bacterium]|nr:SirB2 family protein [Gammaproteobacteria bacterium]MDH4312022.1 SirB2 family protein [Gammaproteobacteria bacterium]MDH5273248.1 SirB2 family protein [Gammaproteobacteria bacterium]
MAEHYLALRHAHIGFAILSVSLFTLRGCLMLARSPHVNAAWLKYPSYLIDTLLLTFALMLMSVIRQYPFGNGWLTMKVVLLVVYVVLGSIALKRGRTRRIRIAALVAALLTVGFLVTVARAHHPLGLFLGLAA